MSDGSLMFSAGRLVRRSRRSFGAASAAEKFVVIGLAAIGLYFVSAMVDVLMAPADAPWSITRTGLCADDVNTSWCTIGFETSPVP